MNIMKRTWIVACGLMMMAGASAQNAYDAERLLGNELNGTARFIGMGGAMSALGGHPQHEGFPHARRASRLAPDICKALQPESALLP